MELIKTYTWADLKEITGDSKEPDKRNIGLFGRTVLEDKIQISFQALKKDGQIGVHNHIDTGETEFISPITADDNTYPQHNLDRIKPHNFIYENIMC